MKTTTNSCVMIVNPTSGRNRGPQYIPALHKVLEKGYEDIVIRLTRGTDDARQLAKKAAMENADIFCMGGDGTINEIINGISTVKNTSSTFGFIPLGTVNDFARALSIPRTPPRAIQALETAVKKQVNVGRINDQYFINIVAAGLIPETVSQVTAREKTFFGPLAYFIKGVQVLPKQKSYHFTIKEKNGQSICVSSPLIAAMLTDSAGSFRNLLPPEERDDSAIKLALFHDFEWIKTLREAPKFLAGFHPSPDVLTVITIKHACITIDEDEKLCTNIDGEPGPCFPIELEILPRRLSVFVPKGNTSPFHLPAFLSHLTPQFKLFFSEESSNKNTTP